MESKIILSLVAAGTVVAFLVYFVHVVGQNASKDVLLRSNDAYIKENNKAAIEKVENEKYFQAMDSAQLDALGRAHGWMRADDDR